MEVMREQQGGIYTGDATSLAQLNKSFWAMLTGFDGDKYYSWKEVLSTEPTDGTWTISDGGKSGSTTVNPAIVANDDCAPINPGSATTNRFGMVLLRRAYLDPSKDWVYIVTWRAGVDAVKITAATLTDSLYFAGQLVVWNGSYTALSPSVPVWLFIDGPNLAGALPWVPTVGSVYPSAMPMTVRVADNIPIYTAKGLPTDLNCPTIPGLKNTDLTTDSCPDSLIGYKAGCLTKSIVASLPTETAPDYVIGIKGGCLVKIAVTTC